MPLPNQVIDIIRIGERLVGSVSRYCDIRSWSWWPGHPVGQHYEVAKSAHCHKVVPVLKLL